MAIVGGYAGYVVNRNWKHRHDVDYFKEYYSMLTKNRFVYSERMMELWKSYYHANKDKPELKNVPDKFEDEKTAYPYLIYENGWEYPSKPIPLNNVLFDSDPKHKDNPKLQKIVDEKLNALNTLWEVTKLPKSRVRLEYIKCKKVLPKRSENHVKCIRRYAQKTVFNGEVIAFDKVMSKTDGEELHIMTHDTDYYNYLNYLDLRALYIVQILEENSHEEEERILHEHLEVLKPLDTSNRPVAIGISSLCIFENVKIGEKTKSFLFVHHRSGNLAEAMNTISLVPAGSLTWDHEPKGILKEEGKAERMYHSNDPAAFSTVIREFEEEILGKSNVEYTEKYTVPEVFNNNAALDTYFLGMGLDPLTTKMEMIAEMVFHCEQNCTDLKEYFSKTTGLEMSPGKNIGYEDILKLSKNASSEGEITIVEIKRNILEEYQHNRKAMPVFKEGIRLLLDDPNFDQKYEGQESQQPA